MDKVAWYVRRLRAMSPAEIGWRVVSVGRSATTGLRQPPTDARLLGARSPDWDAALAAFRGGVARPVLLDRERAATIVAADPAAAAAVVAAADRILAGRVQYFGYPEVELPRPVDWHHDPVTDTRWPRIAASRLDHRSAPGDAKWIWELNRLQHLPWLAEAWLFTGEQRYAETAFEHLDSWLAQNPPGEGIAWRGAFEAGVRLISVAVALQGLRDSDLLTAARYGSTVRLLAESMRRCWTDRSRFSSANNHLVGELAGLAVGALLLPELAGSSRRLRCALDGLAREADLQVLPDGAGAEQAFAYQLFTGDLLLVVAALLRLDGRMVPPAITAALRRSADYLAALVDDGDPVPRYGDDDEGFALRLDIEPVPDVRRHLAAVAAVTGDAQAARCGVAGLTAAWFAGATPAPAIGTAPAPASRHFPHGGLVVLRSAGRRLTMDVGPLGYLAIAAHGHADALAVTLSVDGQELIGDPGAGSYYGHPDWRAVHRSTVAHATVTVDGCDQSVTGGAFLWTEKATTTLRGVDVAAGLVDAEHDGYQRLEAPVRHRRWLVAAPELPTILVVDQLIGSGTHEIRTSWPLHPDLDVTADQGGSATHLVSVGQRPLLHLAHAATAELTRVEVRGDEATGLGWWSQRLESRRPVWLLGAVVRAHLPLVVATTLHVAAEGEPPADLTVELTNGGVTVGWRDGARRRRVEIDTTGGAAVTHTTDDVEHVGGGG
jgi:Heparinase II/III-like protein/Heparinase II/III N-terminus